MKEMYRSSKGVIIGVDDSQWVVADVSIVPELKPNGEPNKMAGSEIQSNERYFSTIDKAIDHAASRVGRREADTLSGYLDVYKGMLAELLEALKA